MHAPTRARSAGIGAIVGVALLLRLPGMRESIWNDELWSTRIWLTDLPTLAHTIQYDLHPPFYHALMFVWITVFGDSELAVRAPALLFGLASIVLTWAVTRRLLGETAAGIAAVLLTVSPPHIWYSQEARHYSAALFFLMLAVWAFYRMQDRESGRGPWILFTLALVLGALTHYYIVVFAPLFVVLSLRPPTSASRRRRTLASAAMTLLFVGAFVGLKVLTGTLSTDATYLSAFTPRAMWELLFSWLPTGYALWHRPAGFGDYVGRPAVVVAQLFLAALFCHGAFRLVRRVPRKQAADLLILMSAPLAMLLALGLAGFDRTYIERSLYIVAGFFAAILAAGLTGLRTRARAGVGLMLAALMAAALVGYYRRAGEEPTVYKPNVDWRSAAAHLRSRQRSDPRPVIVFAATPSREIRYYNPEFTLHDLNPGRRDERPTADVGVQGGLRAGPVGSAGRLRARLGSLKRAVLGVPAAPPAGRHRVYHTSQASLFDVTDLIAALGVTRFFVVRNEVWIGRWEATFGGLRDDPRYVPSGRFRTRHLDVVEYAVRDGVAPSR